MMPVKITKKGENMKSDAENKKLSPQQWAERITAAERLYDDYQRLVKETRESYKAHQRTDVGGLKTKNAFNIFWSSVETQKPFLYFKQPRPYIERVNKNSSPAEALACRILENALRWNLEQFDFDAAVKYARNDYLISGCGILWEQYKPEFETIMMPDGQAAEIKIGEKVVSEYVDPGCFLTDAAGAGVWENLDWIARIHLMNRQQIISAFGENARHFIPEGEDFQRQFAVYEIWDKENRRVLWMCQDNMSGFLKETEDPLGVHGFFPCPKPVFATQTNDSVIPVPDYVMIKSDLDELGGVIERMRLTMRALKVTGAYDSSFSNLANILNKDVSLLAVADFDKLKDAGGLRGVVDFMPIDQYITALQVLAQRRDAIVKNIFEITGVSDIMRGTSTPSETATAVTRKTNFGTLRNQDRQNDMQRFIRDLYRLKAEIICEQFSEENLLSFASQEDLADKTLARQAVMILKTDKMRGMSLSVETECVFDFQEENSRVVSTVQTVSKMIADAFQLVSAQPLLLPLYRQMIGAVVAGLPHSRPFEGVLEKVFNSIERDLNCAQMQKQSKGGQPTVLSQNKPQLPTTAEKIQIEKMRNDYEIEKEKNALKARELLIKEKSELTKAFLSEQELKLKAENLSAGKKE